MMKNARRLFIKKLASRHKREKHPSSFFNQLEQAWNALKRPVFPTMKKVIIEYETGTSTDEPNTEKKFIQQVKPQTGKEIVEKLKDSHNT